MIFSDTQTIALSKKTLILGFGSIVTALILAVATALNPVVYNTLHVTDTTFMLQVSDWVRQGAVPGADFNHFYGGFHEWFVAQGLSLSDGRAKALDYALVLQFFLIAAGLVAIAWKRLDFVTTALLVLLCAVVLFAKFPFEERPFLSNVQSAHSFAYNRAGTALTLLCAAVLLVPSHSRAAELISGVVSGSAAIAAVLAKSTFFPVALAMILGFALMGRWRPLAAFVVSCAVMALLLDPTGARTLATLKYSAASSGTAPTDSWLFHKAFNLIYTQQIAVFAILFLFGCLLWSPNAKAPVARVIGASLILAAFWATSVTMGPAGLAGHQSLPVIAAIALLLLPCIKGVQARAGATALASLLVVAFVVPHTLNILGGTLASLRNSEYVAMRSGPLAGYIALGSWRLDENGARLSMRKNPEGTVTSAAAKMATGYRDATTDYIMLINAVDVVQSVFGDERVSVVSDTRLGVGFAVGAPRAVGFPAWPRESSVEFHDGSNPLRNTSLVLLQKFNRDALASILRSFMEDDFSLCTQSALWELYVRNSERVDLCKTP